MTPYKQVLVNNLYKKLGFDDEDLSNLIDSIILEEEQIKSYKDVVCDTVNEYHNEKKELISLIEELITVVSAGLDKPEAGLSKKQEELLYDTSTNVLIKAFTLLNK